MSDRQAPTLQPYPAWSMLSPSLRPGEEATAAECAACFKLFNEGVSMVSYALAQMLAVKGVPGNDLLVVLFDMRDPLGQQVARCIGVVMNTLQWVEEDLASGFAMSAIPCVWRSRGRCSETTPTSWASLRGRRRLG